MFRISVLSFFVSLANKRYVHVVREGLVVIAAIRTAIAFLKYPNEILIFVMPRY
jgi:hypothetical protein